MKKNISRNPLWPDWYNGKKIDEVQFGRAFLEQWPLKCVNGTLYTLDGPVEDESEIKQRILENIEEYVTSGLSKKVTNILETIKLLAFSDPFPIEQDCIHLQNGVYHLPDGSFQESRLFCQNRLPVKYDPKAASPDRWLTFLHELLDDADIPTLQEYLGYCLIPSTKGQKMMLIVGKGGEGKSRIGLVLKRLMGDAASNGSVQKVENNRFARADLERRLLMIDDDMDMNALPKTNYIKTIVTAEAKLDLERKGVQSYQRDIYARFLCFGNGALTSLYDHSDGFFRRQLILTTKDKPTDRMDDPFLVEKMCAELEGILLWCLEGLHRLVQNSFRFTVSPKAASPDRWLAFLHELLDDADIPTLQEYLGYCLIPSTKGQKMMLIVGKGGEGKSRIGLVLKRLMGDAASNGSVQKVENNRFARADLERRLLMIDDDMDMNALPKTNYIKTIVTAEAKLDLERKGVQSYQRDIYARFLCFGNGALTSLYDHSDGFFRRQLILTTKDKPTDRMDDPFLVEKMCAELEGILLWCLEGLHRLVQNDFRFTVSERAATNMDTIKRSSNNVIDFMESEGYFRFKADYSISSKEFYDIYKQWCEDNACHSVSAIRFSAELRQNDRRYNLEATNNIYLPGGRRGRGFVGIEPLVHPCP